MVVVGLEDVVCVVATLARAHRVSAAALVSYMPLADFLTGLRALRADVSPFCTAVGQHSTTDTCCHKQKNLQLRGARDSSHPKCSVQ